MLKTWCDWGDLNPHSLRHHPLKMACLPIPPQSLVTYYLTKLVAYFQLVHCYEDNSKPIKYRHNLIIRAYYKGNYSSALQTQSLAYVKSTIRYDTITLTFRYKKTHKHNGGLIDTDDFGYKNQY